VATAAKECTNVDIGNSATRSNVGLVSDEHACICRIVDKIPTISVSAVVELSGLNAHRIEPCLGICIPLSGTNGNAIGSLPGKSFGDKVQHPGDTHHFIVFDGEQRRFALNIRHVLASQFDPAKQGGLEGQPVRETGEFSVFTLRTHRHLFG